MRRILVATAVRRPVFLSPVVPTLPVRRFTLAEYHRLIDVGVLRAGDPYELLNGVIAYKMPQNTPHASTAGKLERRFWRMLPDDLFLRTQKPISLPGSDSEPEPDLAVVAGPDTRYDAAHPGPREAFLVVEVADSSATDDGGEKLVIYARAKIPEYWVVNIPARRVEVYSNPRGGKNPVYRTKAEYGPADAVPVVVGGKTFGSIPVKDVLP